MCGCMQVGHERNFTSPTSHVLWVYRIIIFVFIVLNRIIENFRYKIKVALMYCERLVYCTCKHSEIQYMFVIYSIIEEASGKTSKVMILLKQTILFLERFQLSLCPL